MAQPHIFINNLYHRSATKIIGIATVSGISCYSLITQTESPTRPQHEKTNHCGVIETDLMDKLCTKPYLTYHNTHSRDTLLNGPVRATRRIWNKVTRNGSNTVVVDDETGEGRSVSSRGGDGSGLPKFSPSEERPAGVPRRMRILAIDVPEFREVFDGDCRVNLNKVYPDDIVPRKRINKTIMNKTAQRGDEATVTNGDIKADQDKLEIIQKSLARSLVRCRNTQSKRIGVELLEASVYDLNPHNMRKTYQLGSYRYDPGKYRSMTKEPGEAMLTRRATVGGGSRIVKDRNQEEKDYVKETKGGGGDATNAGVKEVDGHVVEKEEHSSHESKLKRVATVISADDDEIDAPWNQYAWIEEMQIRINGFVPFGSNLKQSSFFSRYVFGNYYRRTVPSVRGYFPWIFPSYLSSAGVGGDDGIDGDRRNRYSINRASSKPHAVIADGSAMQRVPGSLRYLTKCCEEADVPLYVVNDPRVWGGNTHADVESAARDMRKAIKAQIVTNALTVKEGSMFERGRLFGRLQTEAKWRGKDVGRKTRRALQLARDRLRKDQYYDLSNISSEELVERLIQRKVIALRKNDVKREEDVHLTSEFMEICKRFLKKEKGENLSKVLEKVTVTVPGHQKPLKSDGSATRQDN